MAAPAPSPHSPALLGRLKRLHPPLKISLVLIALVALAAILALYWKRSTPPLSLGLDRVATARLGDFDITILVTGEVDAVRNYPLRFEGRGSLGLEVVSIVPDKTPVKQGDTVIQLSPDRYLSQLRFIKEELEDSRLLFDQENSDRTAAFEQDIQRLELALLDAKEAYVLFFEQDLLNQEVALGKLTEMTNQYLAEQRALTRYRVVDSRTRLKELVVASGTIDAQLTDARTELNRSQEAFDEIVRNDPEAKEPAERRLEASRKQVAALERSLENANAAISRFRKFDHPQSLRTMSNNLERSQLALRTELSRLRSVEVEQDRRYRTITQAVRTAEYNLEQRRIKYNQDVARSRTKFERNTVRLEERIAELQRDIDLLNLRAPVAGVVSYLIDPTQLGVGYQAKPMQDLVRIPDLSGFIVAADVPEAYRSNLALGASARLRNTAIPDLTLTGTISDISLMSKRLVHRDPRSPRSYEIRIRTENADSRLTPGMTMEIEIVVDRVTNALMLPLESVYRRDDQTYCRVREGNTWLERPVRVGRSSSQWIELLDGIRAGDQVSVQPPPKESDAKR